MWSVEVVVQQGAGEQQTLKCTICHRNSKKSVELQMTLPYENR